MQLEIHRFKDFHCRILEVLHIVLGGSPEKNINNIATTFDLPHFKGVKTLISVQVLL